MACGTIVKSVADVLVVASEIFKSANNEIVFISPPSLLVLTAQYGPHEAATAFIQNGGRVRGIIDFSHPYVEVIRKNLAAGEDVRYFPKYQGAFMIVGDGKESISSINMDTESLTMNTPVVVLWSDSSTYAEYLTSTFEVAWNQSVPAAERIDELVAQERPRI